VASRCRPQHQRCWRQTLQLLPVLLLLLTQSRRRHPHPLHPRTGALLRTRAGSVLLLLLLLVVACSYRLLLQGP
jgi:hypothetical protein